MLKLIPYKNLEKRVFEKNDHLNFGDITIHFSKWDKGKIILEMGVLEDEPKNKYTLQVTMPWGNVYELNRYSREEQAKSAFEFYEATFNKGCNISIIDSSSAMVHVRKT